jgi:hypothetical protein
VPLVQRAWAVGTEGPGAFGEQGGGQVKLGQVNEAFRSRALQRVVAPVVVLAATAAAAPAAMATDRPVGVAHEKTTKQVHLNRDGSLSVVTRLACDPGWQSSDFTVFISQGDVSSDGLVEPAIPCDGRRHVVRYDVPAPGNGTFHRGQAHVNGQFLVFNVESGDPSAAHEQTTVRLRR